MFRLGFWKVLPGTLALMIWRTYPRLQAPGIWAEDGTVFLSSILQRGGPALFEPYAGYFDVLQRGVLWAVSQFLPVESWALVITMFCLVLFAAFAAALTARDYEWLFPDPLFRLCLALLICLLPGLAEMAGNLANINWVLILWMGLWALKNPARGLTLRHVAIGFMILFSTGAFVILLPLYAWRIWYVKYGPVDRRSLRNEWLLLGGLGLMTIVLAVLAATGASKPLDHGAGGLREVLLGGPLGYLKHLFRLGLFRPWLGSRYASHLSDHFATWVGLLAGLGVSFCLAKRLWPRRLEARVQGVTLFFLCVSAWPVLAFLTRPGSIQHFIRWNLLAPMWDSRYAFPLSFAALLFWMMLLEVTIERRKFRFGLLGLFLILNVSHVQRSFWIPPFAGEPPREGELWKSGAVTIRRRESEGCVGTFPVPISPTGWSLEYPCSVR